MLIIAVKQLRVSVKRFLVYLIKFYDHFTLYVTLFRHEFYPYNSLPQTGFELLSYHHTMNNTLIFLRHGPTLKDTNLSIDQWSVRPEAVGDIIKLAESSTFDQIDFIYTSTQIKAVQTAIPFSKRLNKPIIQIPELGELSRPGSEKLSTEDYEKIKSKIFMDLDYTTDNWETSNHALSRYKKAINQIDSQYEGKTILIISHGSVMTLYFCSLQGKLTNIFTRWKEMNFGNWGVVRKGKVVKDIV